METHGPLAFYFFSKMIKGFCFIVLIASSHGMFFNEPLGGHPFEALAFRRIQSTRNLAHDPFDFAVEFPHSVWTVAFLDSMRTDLHVTLGNVTWKRYDCTKQESDCIASFCRGLIISKDECDEAHFVFDRDAIVAEYHNEQ